LALKVLDHVPEGFTAASARNLIRCLPEPTLIHLPGRTNNPLFLTTLLHGNEETGLLAVQEVLRRQHDRPLHRPLLLFIGNVAAAAQGVRTCEGQLDFNRTWPGTPHPDASEAVLLKEVVDYVAAQKPFASIDIHNNTGLNPHYGVVSKLENEHLHLARLFARTVAFSERPLGMQAAAMASICPAVTVECGKTNEPSGTAHAVEFIEACLNLSAFPDHPLQPTDLDLLRTFAIVKVPPEATFSFDGTDADIRFRGDIEHLNFSEVAPGTAFGTRASSTRFRLNVETTPDAAASEYFDYAGNEIRLMTPAIPSMLTSNVRAVRLDCLCYLMHRIDFEGRRQPPD
jgi:hypothetical protein